jgi:hypothetical protein
MYYSIPEGILYQELSGEAVVLNLTTAEYFHLNGMGHAAWELIRAGASLKVIEETLVREYEAPLKQIQSDLEAFLKRMVELKLVILEESCHASPD